MNAIQQVNKGSVIVEMGVDSLLKSATNPRRNFDAGELAKLQASVSKHGILQPLVVRNSVTDYEKWEIVCGERRWRVALACGMISVPVQVKELTDREVVEIQMSENIDRDDLTVYEEGCGVLSLKDCGCTDAEITASLGRDADWVQTRLGIFDLPEVMVKKVEAGVYGESVVAQVLEVNEDQREAACQAVMDLDMGKALSDAEVKELLEYRYHQPNERRKKWDKVAGKLGNDCFEPIGDVEMVLDYLKPWGEPVGNWVRYDDRVGSEAKLETDERITWSVLARAHGIQGVIVPVGDIEKGDFIFLLDASKIRGVEAAIRESGGETTLGKRVVTRSEDEPVDDIGDADTVDDDVVPDEEVFTVSLTRPGDVMVSKEIVVKRVDLDGADFDAVINDALDSFTASAKMAVVSRMGGGLKV